MTVVTGLSSLSSLLPLRIPSMKMTLSLALFGTYDVRYGLSKRYSINFWPLHNLKYSSQSLRLFRVKRTLRGPYVHYIDVTSSPRYIPSFTFFWPTSLCVNFSVRGSRVRFYFRKSSITETSCNTVSSRDQNIGLSRFTLRTETVNYELSIRTYSMSWRASESMDFIFYPTILNGVSKYTRGLLHYNFTDSVHKSCV